MEVDFEPLCTIAAMLYGTSFVAERYSGIRKFLEGHKGAGFKPGSVGAAAEAQLGLVTDARLLPVTRHIIAGSGARPGNDCCLCWCTVDVLWCVGARCAGPSSPTEATCPCCPDVLSVCQCTAPTWLGAENNEQ